MTVKYDCTACRKQVTGTKNDRYRSHSDGSGELCENSSELIPEHILARPVGKDDAPDVPREGVDFAVCPHCDRKVKLTRLGYFEPHETTLRGGERCPVSGVRHAHARKQTDVPLPGDEKPKPGAEIPAVSGWSTAPAPTSESAAAGATPKERPPSGGGPTEPSSSPSPSTGTSETSNSPSEPSPPGDTSSDAGEGPADAGPFHLAPLLGDGAVLQPFSHISQPFPVPPRIRLAEAMSDRGKEIATRLRETFYAYTNRNAKDNRSAQTTLGPSEVGSPCDRQIAMKLLGIQPVNPQEGWAPFVGTAVHEELARMFQWANGAGSGRYVTEMPLTFGSELVPRGTGDLLDRVMMMFLDHKLMGRWSLDKLIQNGPSETYRTQVQVYGLGAELAGEKVKEVAIIGWPRQESSLDKLYVHVEPYDRKVAQAALDRVKRIADDIRVMSGRVAYDGTGPAGPMAAAAEFPVGDDCKWCPFHLRSDKEMKRGCPGK